MIFKYKIYLADKMRNLILRQAFGNHRVIAAGMTGVVAVCRDLEDYYCLNKPTKTLVAFSAHHFLANSAVHDKIA